MKLLVKNPILIGEIKELRAQLSLELISDHHQAFENGSKVCMVFTDLGLGILYKDATKPMYINFADPKKLYRCKTVNQENLCKAVKIKNIPKPFVIDATAGMGEDSFLLAASGCRVWMIERSPYIAALLENGLQKATGITEIAKIASNMTLMKGNSIELLPTLSADVVYIDPMFPARTKSALVKKEMRLFKILVGEDADSDALFKNALACAKYKVVVKKPINAPFLNELVPTYSLKGKVCRFDIYQRNNGA